jgi:hypothetical protein
VTLITSQLEDALILMKGLQAAVESLPDKPDFGEGMRLTLPSVIPLQPDYEGERPVAWLIANDFNGYDLSTTEPDSKGVAE